MSHESFESTESPIHVTYPGALRRSLHSVAQRSLVQLFLEEKAVDGHNSYVSSMALSPKHKAALSILAEKGWMRKSDENSIDASDGEAWQLTQVPLSKVQINMVLHFPWSVFARRAGIPLDQATCFELILTLRSQGWQEKSAKEVKKKKSQPPFTLGSSIV